MPALNSFDYAIIRVVPLVEREELFNASVILFCPESRFLDARVFLDPTKLRALAPAVASELAQIDIAQRLEAVLKICSGIHEAGPIAQLSQRARFHWLVSPRSTLTQISPVHSGLCNSPAAALERLFQEQVRSRTGMVPSP